MEQLAIFRPDIKVSWGNEIPSRHSLFVGPSSDKLIRSASDLHPRVYQHSSR